MVTHPNSGFNTKETHTVTHRHMNKIFTAAVTLWCIFLGTHKFFSKCKVRCGMISTKFRIQVIWEERRENEIVLRTGIIN